VHVFFFFFFLTNNTTPTMYHHHHGMPHNSNNYNNYYSFQKSNEWKDLLAVSEHRVPVILDGPIHSIHFGTSIIGIATSNFVTQLHQQLPPGCSDTTSRNLRTMTKVLDLWLVLSLSPKVTTALISALFRNTRVIINWYNLLL
jgi:hypothetical protein